MKKLFLVLFPVFLFTTSVFAQKYDLAAGVRFGLTDGITVKKMMKRYHAYEAILHTDYKSQGGLLTILTEFHKKAFRLDNLYWFYGFGGHAGVFHGNAAYWEGKKIPTKGFFMNIGIDGILGLEWDIEEIPFTLGADIKPAFDILNKRDFMYIDASFSARYLF